MKILSNIWTLREFVAGLKADARKVILFGSCAEGTDVAESDIDILIITDQEKQVKKSIGGFNRNSERKIAPVILAMDEFIKMKKEDKPLFERIDRGIILWETV
jgi:predicted nucleotidyltransferase